MAKNKLQRMAEHIAKAEEKKGVAKKTAEKIGNAVAGTYGRTGKMPSSKKSKK